MRCPVCQHQSSATARFCESCGAPVGRRTGDIEKAAGHTTIAQRMLGEMGMRSRLEQAEGEGSLTPR